MQSLNTKEKRRVAWTRAGVVALASVLASQPVMAQTSLIFFGDSLTDSGNLYETTRALNAHNSQVPVLPPPSSYYQGRYSNGPTYAETLPGLLGVPDSNVVNFAFAGAESGDMNSHRSAATIFNLLNVDALDQVGRAVSAGAVGPDSLAVYFIGGNDYVNRFSPDPQALQTLVTTVIGNINTGISTLARAGQKNFVVLNLPNMGATPMSRQTPGASDVFGRLTVAHNTALAQAVDGLESRLGVDITLVALDDLFDDVVANPGLYGLSDVTKPCSGQTPPHGTARDCSTAEATDSGLFYDDIHPTAHVHRINAEYVAAYLGMKAAAGADVASRSMLATLSLRSQQRLVQSRLLSMRFGRPMGREAQEEKMGEYTLYLVGDYGSGDRDGQATRRGFDYAVSTGMLGMDRRLGQLVAVGAAVGYSNADQSLDRGRGDADLESYFATVYGTFGVGGGGGGGPFAEGGRGYSSDTFDFSRPTYFSPRPTASADVDGYTWFGLLNGGYDFKVGNAVFGPMIGGRISQSRLDPYTEDAGPVAISVHKATIDGVVGYVGGHVTGRFESGEIWIVPNVRVTVEKDFADEQKVTGTLGSGQIISGDAGDDETAVLIGGGLEFGTSDHLTAQITGEATLGRDDGKDYGIQGRLIFSF